MMQLGAVQKENVNHNQHSEELICGLKSQAKSLAI